MARKFNWETPPNGAERASLHGISLIVGDRLDVDSLNLKTSRDAYIVRRGLLSRIFDRPLRADTKLDRVDESYDRDDLEIEDDQQMARFTELAAPYIGKVIIAHGNLQSSLTKLLLELISTSTLDDAKMSILVAPMRYANLVDAYQRIMGASISRYESHPETRLENELKALCTALRSAGEIRNLYAHSLWGEVTIDGYIEGFYKFKNNKLHRVLHRYNEDNMRQDLQFIERLADSLEDLEFQFTAAYEF